MQTAHTYSHHRAEEELRDKGLLQEVLALANAPTVAVAPKSAPAIKTYFEGRLTELGWAKEPAVDPEHDLTINAMKQQVGLTVQTGNIARAFYDFLKFQVMFQKDRLDVAILIVPTNNAAATMGGNLANYGRLSDELVLYKHVITIPLLLLSFE